jgi:uncharacterized protein YndB with AHSA1/START domain
MSNERELKLERVVDAPRELIWKCWTEPEHLKHWFTPRPWLTTGCKIDLRVGGEFFTMMQSPDGGDFPNHGVYLEIVQNRRLVFTDAYTAGWQPSENPFFTAIVEFEDAGAGKTKYTAHARHWTIENAKKHEEMGFHDGWAKALEQLVEHAKTIG